MAEGWEVYLDESVGVGGGEGSRNGGRALEEGEGRPVMEAKFDA